MPDAVARNRSRGVKAAGDRFGPALSGPDIREDSAGQVVLSGTGNCKLFVAFKGSCPNSLGCALLLRTPALGADAGMRIGGAENWGASSGAGVSNLALACTALAKTTNVAKTPVAAKKLIRRQRGMSLSNWLDSGAHPKLNFLVGCCLRSA